MGQERTKDKTKERIRRIRRISTIQFEKQLDLLRNHPLPPPPQERE